VSYTFLLNNQDVTNYLVDITPVKESKELDDNVLKPEYEFIFNNEIFLRVNDTNSPFVNTDFIETPVRLYETETEDDIITGTINDIQNCGKKTKLIVSIENKKNLDQKILTSWIAINPIEIIYQLSVLFDIPMNALQYRRMKQRYNGVRFSLIGGDITLFEALREIKKKAGIQIYFTNGELYVDDLDPAVKDNSSFTITDDDIYEGAELSQNTYNDELYTDFAFKCYEEGDILLTDENGDNYGRAIRRKFGSIPYDELDGSSASDVRIYDASSGYESQVNYIKMYGRIFKQIDINLSIQKYNAFRLDTIFVWNSTKYNFEKRFEVREITRNYKKGIISVTAWELTDIENKSFTSGYGFNWGGNYGN